MNHPQESKGGCDYLKDSSGEVQFSDVSLRYAADEKYVLKGINFKTESKEKVNLVFDDSSHAKKDSQIDL